MKAPDFLRNLFERRSQVLSWEWVPDTNVVDAAHNPIRPDPKPFAAGDDYVVLRLAEMYLQQARKLWKDRYPIVHAFVAHGDPAAQRSIASVAGPLQLKDLGTENLDRLIGLAYRLAGPLVYDGQDIDLLAGLYAVPSQDGAKLLIDTLGQLSGLIPALKQATDVAGILKGGIEGLLGIAGTELVLGIRDSLRAPGAGVARPARPGFLVAINAPANSIKASNLWIKDGRLLYGENPLVADFFSVKDMMLFELHRGPSRAQVWATLPALAPHAEEFDRALRDYPADQLRAKLNDLYREFEADLGKSAELTRPDKAAVRALIAEDLKRRVAALSTGQLFEARSFSDGEVKVEFRGFSPRDIADLPPGAPLPARPEGQALF